MILNPEQQKVVLKLAKQILEETGSYSKSEAVRILIDAGAKALGLADDVHNV